MSPPRLRPRTASTARLTSSKTSARASDSASFRGKSIGGIHAAVPLKGLLSPGSAGDDGQEVETLGRDEEDKELVVAREPMDDADPEHGPVFRETGEVDVGVLEVPGFVAVEVAVKDPELEEEAEDADH